MHFASINAVVSDQWDLKKAPTASDLQSILLPYVDADMEFSLHFL